MINVEFSPGIIAILAALTVFLTLYAIFTPAVLPKRDKIKEEFFSGANEEVNDSLGKYARPLLNNFLPQFPAGTLTVVKKDKVADFLLKSGNPWKLTPEEYSALKFVFGAIGFFVGLVLTVLNLIPVVPWYVVIGLFLGIGAVLPYSMHDSARQKRTKAAQKQLPEGLDLLVVTLTSGQPFEAALSQVVSQLPEGLIRDEFNKINLKIRAGNTLEKALLAFSREIESDEVESFTKAIIQAQKLGADVTETLSQQATFVRENHEARIEKMIARLSTTMFIPLTVTMIPAFLMIFLAPSVQQFSSML